MKISIISAVYNNKEHIEECINSVFHQTYENIEHIIIDGGSTDGTPELVNRFMNKVQRPEVRGQKPVVEDDIKDKNRNYIFTSEKDKGIYDALNKGIKLASGDVIGLLHSDDVFCNNNVIEKIAGLFEETNADSVYSDLVYVYRENTNKVIRYWKANNFNYKMLNKGWMPPHPTFYVKKNIYEKYGMFDTKLRIASDYDIILRFIKKYKISVAYLNEVTIKMRAGGKSNKSLKNILKKSSEDYTALKHNGMPFPAYTLFYKNIRKMPQFLFKRTTG